MKKSKFIFLVWIAVIFSATLMIDPAAAEVIDVRWSPPYRVSSENAIASAPYMTTDDYGYLHLFWSESGLVPGKDTIKYIRFDGAVWDGPVEVFLSNLNSAVSHISVDVDTSGRLHLVWVEQGFVYYSSAPADHALDAKSWQEPIRLPMQALFAELRVSQDGGLNLVYSQTSIPGLQGIYFQHSGDGGLSWDNLVRLDPDRSSNLDPASVKFEVDDQGGFHTVWYYLDKNMLFAAGGTWVRYSRSLDGGRNWSLPFTIDEADEDPDELRMPLPALVVSGNEVHIVWAGDSAVHREHRYSMDYGVTWSNTRQVFGELMGQARGDGLAVDSSGRVHFIGNIRWPTALYYSMFDNRVWSPVSLVYLIAYDAENEVPGAISAHDIRLAIQGGNYLVTAFGDTPGAINRGLFVMQMRMEDTPANEPIPTPSPVPTVTPEPSPTPTPTTVPLQLPVDLNTDAASVPTQGYTFVISMIVATVFLGGIVTIMRIRASRS